MCQLWRFGWNPKGRLLDTTYLYPAARLRETEGSGELKKAIITLSILAAGLIVVVAGMLLLWIRIAESEDWGGERSYAIDAADARALLSRTLESDLPASVSEVYSYEDRYGMDPYFLFRFRADRSSFEQLRPKNLVRWSGSRISNLPKRKPPDWFAPFEPSNGRIEVYADTPQGTPSEYLVYRPAERLAYFAKVQM